MLYHEQPFRSNSSVAPKIATTLTAQKAKQLPAVNQAGQALQLRDAALEVEVFVSHGNVQLLQSSGWQFLEMAPALLIQNRNSISWVFLSAEAILSATASYPLEWALKLCAYA